MTCVLSYLWVVYLVAVNNVIGDAWIEIHGKTDKLKKDIEDAFKLSPASQKKMQENLQKSVDTAFRKLDMQKYLDMDFDVKAKLDSDQLVEELLALETLLSELSTVHIKVKVDDSALDELQSLMNIVNETKTIKIVADSAEAAAEIKKTAQKTTAEIEPEVASGPKKLTQLELAILTRDRIVNVRTMIDKNVPAQFIKAFTGYRLTQEALEIGFDVLLNLDRMVPKIALITGGAGYLSGVLVNLLGDVSGVLRDVIRILPAVIPIPGILLGFSLGLGGLIAALKDFGKVLPGVGKEFKDLQDIISSSFWEEAKVPIKDFIDTLMPQLKESYKATGTELGNLFANLSESMKRTLLTAPEGGRSALQFIFEKLNESIRISSEYTDEFSSVLTQLGVIGAQYLPRLSKWMGELITKFDTWLKTADLTGMIDNALVQLGYFGDAVVSLYGIFRGLGTAAEQGGSASLKSFSESLERVRQQVESPGFQTALANLFRSANDMMKEIAERSGPAVKAFFVELGENLQYTFDTLGPALGDFIREFSEAFSTPKFSASFREFIDGVATGIQGFSGSLGGIADGVGEFLEIIGTAVENLLPLLGEILVIINEWTEVFSGAIEFLIETLGKIDPMVIVVITAIVKLTLAGTNLVISLNAIKQAITGLTSGRFLAGFFNTSGQAAVTAAAGTSKFSTALVALQRAFLPLAAVAAIGSLIKWGSTLSVTVPQTEDLARSLVNVEGPSGRASKALKDLFSPTQNLGGALTTTSSMYSQFATGVEGADFSPAKKEIETISDAIDAFGETAAQATSDSFVDKINNFFSGTDKVFEEQAAAMDSAWASMVEGGNMEAAKQQYEMFMQSAKESGADIDVLREKFPQFDAAIAANTDELGRNKDALDKVITSYEKSQKAFIDNIDATIGLNNARKDFDEVLKNEAAGWDLTTESTQRKWAALKEVGEETSKAVLSEMDLINATDTSVTSFLNQQNALYESAKAAGMGEEQARDFTQAMLDIPRETIVEFLARDNVKDTTIEVGNALLEIDGKTGTVFYNSNIIDFETARNTILGTLSERLQQEIQFNTVNADGQPMSAVEQVEEMKRVFTANNIEIPAGIDQYPAEQQMAILLASIDENETEIKVGANTESAGLEIGTVLEVDGQQITIDANTEISQAMDGIVTIQQAGQEPIQFNAETGQLITEVDAAKQEITTPAEITMGLNTDQAYLKYAAMKADIRGDVATIDVDANTNTAYLKYAAMKADIRGDVATLNISANIGTADGVVAAFKSGLGAPPGYVTISAKITQAEALLSSLKAKINTTEKITIDAITDPATKKLSTLKTDAAKAVSFTVNAYTDTAVSKINTMNSKIVDRYITVYVREVRQNADGNIFPSVKAFANGGFENHIAQISRPMSIGRLWAEPETGGEAYIPLAMSKRSRSLDILEEVARIFGYMIAPKGKSFADGGIYSSSRNTSPENVNAQYNVYVTIDPKDLRGIRDIEEFVTMLNVKQRQLTGKTR